MNRGTESWLLNERSLSHASGNVSVSVVRCLSSFQFVPRKWECVAIVVELTASDRVCPAYVGVSRGAKLDRTVMFMWYPTQVGMNRRFRRP